MLCAGEPDLVAGLLLLSYPLHPPRKPAQLRVQHLPGLRVPALFVHGTRDPFGSIEEMEDGGEDDSGKDGIVERGWGGPRFGI